MVFDASAKSSNGVSLNDILEPGPSLYPLLSTVINRFRLPLVGLSADISKMFRDLQSSECDLHRFLLTDEHSQFHDYRMKRLTFGVSSSPFMATRVLLQLADDHEHECPRCKVTFSFIAGQEYTCPVSSCWPVHDVYDDNVVLHSQAAESCKKS